MRKCFAVLLSFLFFALVFQSGCASDSKLHRDANKIKKIAVKARETQMLVADKGGEVCGVKELAYAEANRAFALYEIDQGDFAAVRRHISEGQEYADEALKKAKACGPDRDEDGVLDMVDECPDDPEDIDEFEDEEGCPDPDNDQDGILDEDDRCPVDAEDQDDFEDEDGCPDVDNDKDQVLDEDDRCPNEPEDRDEFEDNDGCPDPDNDQDGILDSDDECPNEAETFNGNKDEDGCPDEMKYSLVSVTDTKIELKQMVFFRTGKATILPKSFALLNEVAQVLKDYAKMKVRIEGHTDNVGNDRNNMRLSQKRAESVRAYLIEKGVAGDKMVAKGYGETQPIASNRTLAGRAKNRRVEFMITER